MFAARRQAPQLLRQAVALASSGAAESSAAPLLVCEASAAAAASVIHQNGPFKGVRFNHALGSSSYLNLWAHPHIRVAKQQLDLARSMLPHRAEFAPQFMPHGVQLMPERLPLAAACEELDEDEEDGTPGEAPMQADSTKRKRRLKMKRHKHKKRMKAMRHRQ